MMSPNPNPSSIRANKDNDLLYRSTVAEKKKKKDLEESTDETEEDEALLEYFTE